MARINTNQFVPFVAKFFHNRILDALKYQSIFFFTNPSAYVTYRPATAPPECLYGLGIDQYIIPRFLFIHQSLT